VGTAIGAVAGFYGRWIDQVLSRLTDLVLIIPAIAVLAIAGKYLGGGSPAVLILILSALFWTYVARVVRGLVLALKEKDFVEGARLGAVERPDRPPPRSPEHDRPDRRRGDAHRHDCDPRRIGAVVPRVRRAGAVGFVGEDAVERRGRGRNEPLLPHLRARARD